MIVVGVKGILKYVAYFIGTIIPIYTTIKALIMIAI